jgi:pimeloyl-ACP methyl ester carboxylesterase
VLYGESAGGLSVLLAGAEGLRPLAVISDSGFVSMRNEAAHDTRMPAALLAPFDTLYPWFSGGGHVLDVGSELRLHPGYHVATLIIQGTDDRIIYWHNGPTLARLTHGTLWLLAGVGHVGAFQAAPKRYAARTNDFIQTAETREAQR